MDEAEASSPCISTTGLYCSAADAVAATPSPTPNHSTSVQPALIIVLALQLSASEVSSELYGAVLAACVDRNVDTLGVGIP